MQILLAPDKFRGSLTAIEVCEAMKEGALLANPSAKVMMLPMADGGEGTTEILTYNAGGHLEEIEVLDPLGRLIKASFGLSKNKNIAFVEMAAASGLHLLKPNEYNPLITNTFGTGQLILSALSWGAEKIVLGIGGSATNDAGTGMAAALGWKFLDKNQKELYPCGENLAKIEKIMLPQRPLAPFHCLVACDVTNPLSGPNGAAYVYAPQKGATEQMVESLDAGLAHFAQIVHRDFGIQLNTIGAGAAGGLGAGTLFFLNATLKSGIEIVMEQTKFYDYAAQSDLILTGEGKIDIQSLQGKLIGGIGAAAKKLKKPVVAICGTLLIEPQKLQEIGILYTTSIINRPMNLEEALANAYQGVLETTFSLVSFYENLKYR